MAFFPLAPPRGGGDANSLMSVTNLFLGTLRADDGALDETTGSCAPPAARRMEAVVSSLLRRKRCDDEPVFASHDVLECGPSDLPEALIDVIPDKSKGRFF